MGFGMSREEGFSLIEALASVGLCALVIFVLVAVLNYSLYLNAYSKDRLIAMNDARRITEQVRTVADTNGLSGAGSVTSPTTPWSSLLSNKLPSESVQVTTSGSDPLTVTVRISWLEKNRTENFQFATKVTHR